MGTAEAEAGMQGDRQRFRFRRRSGSGLWEYWERCNGSLDQGLYR